MESFVVSARKYRPATFDDVVGQQHITTTLKNALATHKVAQAFLFCGPRGVGKTTCARILARLINGAENEHHSLSIFELDAASNNSVEDVRRLIEQVRYPPQYGKYKTYIIDEVHMLSTSAFNAFLKTLEEPPPYAIFILATTEKQKVLPTILSRCQIFDFNRILVTDITSRLQQIAHQEQITIDPEAAHLIAKKADGSMRDALSMFDLMATFSAHRTVSFSDVLDHLHILDSDYYFTLIDDLLAKNYANPLLLLDQILRNGFDAHHFIAGLGEHIRNLIVSKDQQTTSLMDVPSSVQKKYMEQGEKIDTTILFTWLSLVNTCDIHYKISQNQRLLVELTLMKMARLNEGGKVQSADVTNSDVLKKKVEKIPSIPNQPAPRTTSDQPQPPQKNDRNNSEPKHTLNLNKIYTSTTDHSNPVTPSSIPNQLLDSNTFSEAWKSFSEIKKENPLEFNLFSLPYTRNETTVTIHYENATQENILSTIRQELQTYLYNQLHHKFTITGKATEKHHQKIPYTNREKLEHMTTANPVLVELKKRLDLDTDF